VRQDGTEMGNLRLHRANRCYIQAAQWGEKHEYRVGLILSKGLKKLFIEWIAVSECLIMARLNNCLRKVTVIQCYAPTNEATSEEKEAFMACWRQPCTK